MDGQTDNMCENSDHGRIVTIGRPSGSNSNIGERIYNV